MNFKKTKIYILYDLLNQGFGKYKPQIIILSFLGFLSGLLEGVGVNAVIPMFSFLFGGNASSDFISRIIKELFGFLDIRFSLRYLLVFVVVLFIVRAIVLFFCNFIRIKISADYEEQTRKNLFSKMLEARWSFLLDQKLGHLDTILTTNIQNSGLLLQYLGNLIMVFSGLIMYAIVAINISLPITLMTLAFGFLLLIFFKPLLSMTKSVAREKEKLNKYSSHFINENVLGLKTIKSLFVESQIMKEAQKNFRNLKELTIKSSIYGIFSDSLIQPIGMIFVCAIFAVAYKMPGFNFAALVAIIYLIQRMFTYVQQFQSSLNSMSWSAPYLEGVLRYEKEAENNLEKNIDSRPFVFEDRLDFKNIGFSYSSNRQILKDVNFSIKKGEMIGIIGGSGVGKTTIVDLILRFFDTQNGEILIDGINIKEISLANWRQNIGYVSQDVFIKNDTVYENIRFYDETISDHDVEEAARSANIYDFIQGCPEKFLTVVGERGVLLSAGQRQRIVIARILVRKPKILIFDEATSALDNESEAQIQEVIETLKNKVTVLLIAHRLSTVMSCDKLLVLQNGKIKEQGSPKDLLNNENSYFFKAYNIRKQE